MPSGCDRIFNKPKEVASADIKDAYFLGIDQSKDFNMDTDVEQKNNLIKITSNELNADPVTVDFLDESGETLGNAFTYVNAGPVVLLSERFSALWGEFKFKLKGGETHSNGLLLDHQTGAVFDLGYQYEPMDFNDYLGSKYYQQDKNGNIYFFTGGIKRLLIKDDTNIQVELYMDYWDSYFEESYFVDLNGNIFFDRGRMVKLSSGGIIETGSEMICINGFDHEVIGFELDIDDYETAPPLLNVLHISISNQSIEKKIVTTTDYYGISKYHHYYPDKVNNRHFIFSTYVPAIIEELDIELSAGICYDESLEKICYILLPSEMSGSFQILGLESSYLWIQDSGNESRLFASDITGYIENEEEGNLVLNDFVEFQLPDGIEIELLRFNEERIVEFSAYDLLNEKQIKGFISMANGLEYYEEESDLWPVTLTRIK